MKFKLIDDDFDDVDYIPLTKQEAAISNDLFNFIQSLISNDNMIKEDFLSRNSLNNHFEKHCLNNNNKKSGRQNVYYDFNNKEDYRNYGDSICEKLKNTKYIIPTLNDVPLLNKYMRKLFEGNINLLFTLSCGFKNNVDGVMVGLHSFSSDVTKNYSQNTLDIVILSPTFKIISIYPVDANYFENKFDSIIENHSDNNLKLKINH